jgi:hypothetical protein
MATLMVVGMAVAQADDYWKGLPPGVVLEASVETTAGDVIFPSTTSGRLQVRDCGGCLHATIQIDGNTQFNLAGSFVSLREMTDFARGKPGTALTIQYRLKDLVASRVSVLSK